MEGRELDAAVGEALGLEKRPVCEVFRHGIDGEYGYTEAGTYCYDCQTTVGKAERVHRRYSEDIPAAWGVLQHLWDEYGFEASATPDGPKGAACVIEDRSTVGQPLLERADTAPLAIARAALKAVRHTSPPTSP